MNPQFEVHILNHLGKAKATAIAKAFDELLDSLKPCMTEGPREAAIVATKLEEACFFAKKAMAKNPGNIQGDDT